MYVIKKNLRLPILLVCAIMYPWVNKVLGKMSFEIIRHLAKKGQILKFWLREKFLFLIKKFLVQRECHVMPPDNRSVPLCIFT